MEITVSPGTYHGTVTVPPSKSAAHRAIIAAALANGRSVIGNVDLSSDILATIGACRSLGCDINIEASECYNTLTVDGGLSLSGETAIDCAESGSTLRFFIPVACTLSGTKTFTGHGRLPYRPVDAYLEIFNAQSVGYSRPSDANLPLTVSGRLHGGEMRVDGRVSSQYVTGLLFALPVLQEDSAISVLGGFESRGYVDLTVDMLRRFGINIGVSGDAFTIKGGQRYQPRDIVVEGDYSQAAFFIVAGAIAGDIRIAGLEDNSLQPDSAIVSIMRRMGARITQHDDALIVTQSNLSGTVIDVSQCPDLVPPLAIAAAFAKGETRITGAARLRIKECDRLHALSVNLNNLGIQAAETADELIIRGGLINGGTIDTFGDHRIAMAFAVAAAGATGDIRIPNAECIDKSYPKFYDDLKALGGQIK
jgi:3-phosphoshikimate 1-carboxyvinyltransferase